MNALPEFSKVTPTMGWKAWTQLFWTIVKEHDVTEEERSRLFRKKITGDAAGFVSEAQGNALDHGKRLDCNELIQVLEKRYFGKAERGKVIQAFNALILNAGESVYDFAQECWASQLACQARAFSEFQRANWTQKRRFENRRYFPHQ